MSDEKTMIRDEMRGQWLSLLACDNPHLLQGDVHGALCERIAQAREVELEERTRNHFEELCRLLASLHDWRSSVDALGMRWKRVGERVVIDGDESGKGYAEIKEVVDRALVELIPWRKGPFQICGTFVDAEWKSIKKWERLKTIYDIDLLCKDKCVLDIGCNNGYYSFLMQEYGAKMVLGIDPMPRYAFFSELYKLLLPSLPLYYEKWGVEVCVNIPKSFDTVFCMGILYHQRNPILMLEQIYQCMKDNAVLVLESICLNDFTPYCLVPSNRYMKAKGYWYIPSVEVIKTWLYKAGFEVLSHDDPVKTNLEEQRHTSWLRGESLESFLDMNNDEYTIEGYPAPYRVLMVAKKRF